jgi:TP901 family phage tail tape measure protein
MTGRDFLFGFKFLATDYVSPVLKNIESRIEAVNTQVKNTERWRTAGTNLIMLGAGIGAAGGAIGLGLKSAVDAAAEMQTVMTHVRVAMNDGAATQEHLNAVQAVSEKLAIASGIGAKQLAQGYYIARSNMLDHTTALAALDTATKLAIGTTASLADAQTQLEPTTRMLTTVYQNFGDKTRAANGQIAGFADTMAKLQTQYAFGDISEVNYAMQYAVPLAKAAKISFNDMSASLALLSEKGLHGAEAGTAFSELVTKLLAGGKLRAYMALNARGGIDLEKTMERLRMATAGMAPVQEALWLHQMGFTERSMRGVALLLDATDQYKSTINDLNNAQGANAAAFLTRQASMEIATGRLSAAWDVFKTKIGEQLLGPVTAITTELTKALSYITAFVGTHPMITKFAVTFAALGAAIAVVAGGAIAMAGGLLAAASFIGIGGGVIAMVAGIGAAIAATTAYLYTWHPAFLVTIGSIVKDVGAVLLNIGKFVVDFFTGHWEKMFTDAGWNLVKALCDGIWKGIDLPIRAIHAVASKIRGFLPFSPAKEGPLRYLHQTRIVETIADSIRPGPALTAMRRAGAAIAVAAPMMFSPMMSSSAMASSSGGARGGGITIQVHQEIHIDGATAGDERKLMEALGRHGRELGQIIEAQLRHNARREF